MAASARRKKKKKKRLHSSGINTLQTSRNIPAVCTNTAVNTPAFFLPVVPRRLIGPNVTANLLLPFKARRDTGVKLKNFEAFLNGVRSRWPSPSQGSRPHSCIIKCRLKWGDLTWQCQGSAGPQGPWPQWKRQFKMTTWQTRRRPLIPHQ